MAEFLRKTISAQIGSLVVGDSELPLDGASESDPGLIPLDSPVRHVHQDPSGFIGGVRSLLFQTLHPDAMYAVAQHSVYEDDPLGRLQRTARFLGATVFGSGTEAQQAIEIVNRIHKTVTGELPDGRTYRADDPHLVGWVHATEVDSFLAAHQRYGSQPLNDQDCDRYVADMSIVGRALGGQDLPQTQAELAEVLEMYRTECRATPECRDTTRFLFAPQLPLTFLPFYGVIFAASTAMLPAWARSMLLLPVAPGVDPLVIRPAAEFLTRTIRWAGPTHPTTKA